MEKHLYKEHFELEKKHWWFISKNKIIMSFVRKNLPRKSNPKILDAGCGPGPMLNDLSKLGSLSAMDYSQDAIEFCKTKNTCDLRQGSFPDNVPFEKNQFDLIVCLDVIEHIDDDRNSVKALHDLLVNDGKMIITVPALMCLWSRWDDLNAHKRRYNIQNFKEVLSVNNFEIEKISYYNSFLFPIVFVVRWFNETFNKNSKSSDTDMPSPLANYILTKIFSFEEVVLRYSNFPIGVSLIAVVRKK